MKAAFVHKIGDVTTDECMTVREDLPTPEPAKGQVLIKVHAAAINPVDWKMAEGMVPGAFKGGVFGADVSGVVEKIGPGRLWRVLRGSSRGIGQEAVEH